MDKLGVNSSSTYWLFKWLVVEFTRCARLTHARTDANLFCPFKSVSANSQTNLVCLR